MMKFSHSFGGEYLFRDGRLPGFFLGLPNSSFLKDSSGSILSPAL